MSKRKSDDADQDMEKKYLKRIKKYQEKLKKINKASRLIYDADIVQNEDNLEYRGDESSYSLPYSPHGFFQEDNDETMVEEAVETVPAADPEAVETVPAADPELLSALGEFETLTTEWGDPLQQEIVQRWTSILLDGLKKEKREEMAKKYGYASNLPLLKPPEINPEVSAMLTDSSSKRDQRLLNKQATIGHALSALGAAMSGMLTKTKDNAQILRIISDASSMIADAHFSETETRRALITPLLDKSFIEPLKKRKRDSFLFAENLGEFIKSSRAIKTSGQFIQASSTATPSHLNAKSPLSRAPARGSRTASHLNRASGYNQYNRSVQSRGGGRASQHYQRRQQPQPVPPPRRAAQTTTSSAQRPRT